jgi:hypothetical protein
MLLCYYKKVGVGVFVTKGLLVQLLKFFFDICSMFCLGFFFNSLIGIRIRIYIMSLGIFCGCTIA